MLPASPIRWGGACSREGSADLFSVALVKPVQKQACSRLQSQLPRAARVPVQIRSDVCDPYPQNKLVPWPAVLPCAGPLGDPALREPAVLSDASSHCSPTPSGAAAAPTCGSHLGQPRAWCQAGPLCRTPAGTQSPCCAGRCPCLFQTEERGAPGAPSPSDGSRPSWYPSVGHLDLSLIHI